MWEMIGQIALKQHQDEMEIYCQALQEANAKYTWLDLGRNLLSLNVMKVLLNTIKKK